MISLQRLNGTTFWLNPELIEQIDRKPDTVITLTTGNNFVVLESVERVVEKILEYRRSIAAKRRDAALVDLEKRG